MSNKHFYHPSHRSTPPGEATIISDASKTKDSNENSLPQPGKIQKPPNEFFFSLLKRKGFRHTYGCHENLSFHFTPY